MGGGRVGTIRKRFGRYGRQLLQQTFPGRVAEVRRPAQSKAAPFSGPPSPIDRKRAELATSRAMGPYAVEWLLAFLESADEVVTLREASSRGGSLSRRVVALRHDVDHDIENAVRLAVLENAAGLKATYFVLHSAWYYRWDSDGRISNLTLEALERIASMGHEIALHNDGIGVAVETGLDPTEVLHRELEELRSHGFDIVGTSGHGGRTVRNAGLRNYHIFAEYGGDAPRIVETANGGSLSFTPVPEADFGLEYEAYSVAQTLYLSDPRARWSQPPQWVASEFRQEHGPLQILTHPEHWALSGETLSLRNAPHKRPRHNRRRTTPAFIRSVEEDRPMRIISRGDCCSRRAVNMNKDLFGGHVQYIKDEMSRSDFLVDHPMVGSPGHGDIMSLVAVERIRSAAQRYYQFCQTDRATLDVRDADLLVLDSYGDMNFQAWQHRSRGWRLWAPMALLRDRDLFMQEFQSVGYLTLEESVAYHVALIEHYRRMNGDIPVLFLHQPIAYYDKLQSRAEFVELGARLEQEVPQLYHGLIEDDDLQPDDMDSSGPGQTLHFTAETYRAMIDVALEKGLSQWMPRISAASRS